MNRSERYQKMVEPELTHLNLRWEDISQQIRVRSFKVKFLVFYSTSYIVYMYVSLFPVLINFLFHWPFFHENQLGREVFIFTLLLCQKCGYGGFHIIHSQKKYLGRFLFDFFYWYGNAIGDEAFSQEKRKGPRSKTLLLVGLICVCLPMLTIIHLWTHLIMFY